MSTRATRWFAGVGCLAVVTLCIALPLRAAAQEVLPATLLRRLGSAVEGYRTGRPVWVVAALRFPHEIRGVYQSAAEASRVAMVAGAGYRPFGPYISEPDTTTAGASVEEFGIICVKQPDTRCLKDSTRTFTTVDNVSQVVITIALKAEAVRSDTLRPDQVEAVFFTMSAVDKLLIPYYTTLYGSRYAARVREEYLTNLIPRQR